MKRTNRVLELCGLLLLLGATLFAQNVAVLTGRVLDPSGAAIPKASVIVSGPNNTVQVLESDANGSYKSTGNLPPGAYTVRVTANGFGLGEKTFDLPAGRVSTLDVTLSVAAATQEVTVSDTQSVQLDPAQNAGALVLKEQDLDILSDDPDDLQADLLALAGPSVGPNGGQIYVDGFSNGQLPPKESIREIRINSNPFSAEYDKVGFGRIEIFTKPGTDKLRGSAQFNFGDNALNARNPYSLTKPPFQSRQYSVNLTGSLNKKTTFNLEFQHRNQDETSFVNATALDSSFNPIRINTNIPSPTSRTQFSPRIDYALTPNITLQFRYTNTRFDNTNNGVGNFNLPSRATDSTGSNQNFSVVATDVLNTRTINETRFQWQRNNNNQNGDSSTPTINVLDSFTGGGAPFSLAYNHSNNYEIQNYTSYTHGPHFLKFGLRLRQNTQDSYSTSNYNGTYTFTSLNAYSITEEGIANGLSLDQIRALGGGPSQYTVAGGTPLTSVGQLDVAPFIQDDWRVLPSVTLSLGLRYEIQTNNSDKKDWAPRVGIAWGLGSGQGRLRQPKTVLRAGFGIFYDRISQSLTLDALRQNGITQQTYTIPTPPFYPVAPPVETLTAARVPQNIRIVDSKIVAPSITQFAVGVDRQLPRGVTMSVNVTDSIGNHQLRSVNINAPLPPSGFYPYGNAGPIYMYESSGVFRQYQISTNISGRVANRIQLFGYYVYGQAHSDTDSSGSFPANPYDFSNEYGRAGFDIRHRFQMGGNGQLPFGLRLNPNIEITSAPPFNITTGKDNNGDSIFNDRPAFATVAANPALGVFATPWGVFNADPIHNPQFGSVIIPRNYGTAYPNVRINLRLSRQWFFGERNTAANNNNGNPDAGRQRGGGNFGGGGFGGGGRGGNRGGGGFGGGRGGGGGNFDGGGNAANRRYSLQASIQVQNAINTVNPPAPNGNLSSTFFGQSLGNANAVANRRVDLSLRFQF
jgi:hypothetical protein